MDLLLTRCFKRPSLLLSSKFSHIFSKYRYRQHLHQLSLCRSLSYNSNLQCSEYFDKSEEDDISVDVAIVGAGPSGLATGKTNNDDHNKPNMKRRTNNFDNEGGPGRTTHLTLLPVSSLAIENFF